MRLPWEVLFRTERFRYVQTYGGVMRRNRRCNARHGSRVPCNDTGRFGSRLVAMAVAVAMAVGLAGASAAAYGDDDDDDAADHTQPTTAEQPQNMSAAAENVDAPQHAKRITKNDDGTYTLSMDVTGKSSGSTEQQIVPFDIALVLDVSGSMDDPSGSGKIGESRLDALKQAVTNFLSQVEDLNQRINDDAKKVQVALIKFAGDNSDKIGNDMYDSGEDNYSQTVHALAWEPTQLQQERDAVNALRAGGVTRSDFGLQHAVTQLGLGRAGAQKLTIFYSDGSPNKNGNGFEKSVANKAIKAAKQLKTANSQVISIGAMPEANPDGTDNANKFMNYVSSNYPDAKSMKKPGARGTGTYYYALSASTDLKTIFDKIISIITSGTAYQDVTMTDTLSNYVEFSQPDAPNFGAALVIRDAQGNTVQPADVGLVDAQGAATYTITTQPASKTIAISFPKGYALKYGYTYSLEYRIAPSAKAYEDYAANVNAGLNGYGENPSTGADGTGDTSEGQPGFLSNEKATIDYTPRVDDEPKEPITGTEYPHPVIQVDPAEFAALKIHKTWIATDPTPDKVTVDVSCKGANGGECAGYRGIDITKNTDSWTSTVLIPKAAAIRTYTVTERPLDGFRTQYTNRDVTIPADTAGEYTSTVTNYPASIGFDLNRIRVGKTVQGTDTDQDFTFTLSPNGAEGVTNMDGTSFTNATLTLGDRFADGTQVTGTFADASIKLPTPQPGEHATYTFDVKENAPVPSAGWAADTDTVTVTVTVGPPTQEGTIPTTVAYRYAAGDADNTEANRNLAAFTNHWIAVSQLPLTGEGGATPLLWLAIGGGLGALALLTGGGVAIWRKRRLI